MTINSEEVYTITLTQEEAYQLDEQLKVLMNEVEEPGPMINKFYDLLPYREME